MKTPKYLVPVILTLITSLAVWNFLREKIYVGDSDFGMQENILAPDGDHRIIKFEIDIGALGYSGWTAITPAAYQDLNLAGYKIPRRFDALGWMDDGELIISIEDFTAAEQSQIKTGDALQGVKVQIVNADDYLLKQGIKRAKTKLP